MFFLSSTVTLEATLTLKVRQKRNVYSDLAIVGKKICENSFRIPLALLEMASEEPGQRSPSLSSLLHRQSNFVITSCKNSSQMLVCFGICLSELACTIAAGGPI